MTGGNAMIESTTSDGTIDEHKDSISLLQLLTEAELTSYYSSMKSTLKLRNAFDLKYATDIDLAGIGMSKPEQRRLSKVYQRHFSASLFAKFRKRIFGKQSTNDDNNRSLIYTDDTEQHIIPVGNITLCKQLGHGEFGAVWQGVWQNSNDRVQVAVKCVESDKLLENPLNFLHEAAIMHKISHSHIVRLFGVVLDTKSIMLVSELAPLRSLLECIREKPLRASFPPDRLCVYVEQICDGMCYLETQRLIHRDLAARNILVFTADKVKISDFGLSRSLDVGEDYYRCNFSVSLKLPIAWCAPESINFLKFTSASDVWAFGVTLWEMFTYGFQPWAGMTGAQILSAIDAPRMQRLDQPDACPIEYYNLMLQCWEHDPNRRPKFIDIARNLSEMQPDRVRTICACRDGQLDHLQYDKGDVITVLDKRPKEYPDGYFWRGIVKCGRTGLFLPGNTVAQISVEYPSCNLPSSTVSGATRSSTVRVDKRNNNKVQRPIISEPQGDFRHTCHVGIDGTSFGQLFTDKKNLPHQMVAPLIQTDPNVASSSRSDVSPRKPRAPSPPCRLGDKQMSFTSTSESTLLDEVFEALHASATADESSITTDQTNCSLMTMSEYHSDTTRLLGDNSSISVGNISTPTTAVSFKSPARPIKPKPEALVRPMSQIEAKKWTENTERAHRRADKSLDCDYEQQRDKLASIGIVDTHLPSRSNSIKDRVVGSLKAFSRSKSRDSCSDNSSTSADTVVVTKSFSDELTPTRDMVPLADEWSDEAQDAYKLLVLCGRGLQQLNGDVSTPAPSQQCADADDNPLRRLRSDDGSIVRSFRPKSNRTAVNTTGSIVYRKAGPPVPPKPTRPIESNFNNETPLLDHMMRSYDAATSSTITTPIDGRLNFSRSVAHSGLFSNTNNCNHDDVINL